MKRVKTFAHWLVAGVVAGMIITGYAHARHERAYDRLRELVSRPSMASLDGLHVILRMVADSVEADVRWTPAASWRPGDSVRVSGVIGAIVGTLVDTALAPDAGSLVIRRPFDPGAGEFICASFRQHLAVIRTWGPGRAVHGELALWTEVLKVRGPRWQAGFPSCAGHDLTYSGTSVTPAPVADLTGAATIVPPAG